MTTESKFRLHLLQRIARGLREDGAAQGDAPLLAAGHCALQTAMRSETPVDHRNEVCQGGMEAGTWIWVIAALAGARA